MMDRLKLQKVIAGNEHFTESRKVSLYSNFARLEEVNPDGFEANVTAWQEVLEDAVRLHAFPDATCISAGPELIANLSDPANGTPLALNTVIDQMVKDGSLVPLQWYQRRYPSSPPSGLGANTARMLSRLVSALVPGQWHSGDSGTLRAEKYVEIRAAKASTDDIVSKLTAAADKEGNNLLSQVFHTSQVPQLVGNAYSSLDLECCLAFAAANNQIFYDKNREIVKVRRAGPITDVDATVASLRVQIHELNEREASLARQVAEYEAQARAAVKISRKSALQVLQKKNIAEKSHARTLELVNQLETVLHKIDDASDNKQSLEALKTGSAVLAELNKASSVGDVDRVIDELQDAISSTDEVSQGLSELRLSSSEAADLEELEIDNELAALEEEETAKRTSDRLDKLPAAPAHAPRKTGAKADKAGGAKADEASESQREPSSAIEA